MSPPGHERGAGAAQDDDPHIVAGGQRSTSSRMARAISRLIAFNRDGRLNVTKPISIGDVEEDAAAGALVRA